MYGPPQAQPMMPPGPPQGGADPQSALLMAILGGQQGGGGLPVPMTADFAGGSPAAQLAVPPGTPGVAPPMPLDAPGDTGQPMQLPPPGGGGEPGMDQLMAMLLGGPRPPASGGPGMPPGMALRGG